jgi:hypothetical protein
MLALSSRRRQVVFINISLKIINLPQNVPMGDETRRFAVVNMDWDVVKAGDLMKLFDAFKPATGVIHSVKIYPSEFGKERMAIEDRQGPPAEIFNGPNRSSSPDSDNSSEDDDEDAAAGADTQQVIKDILASSDSKVEFNQTALRRYQLERLRYFYAVVDCDSLRTAKSIYDQCDGSEYESSAVFLDLRYIPDHVQFDEEMPRDTATRVPANYQPKGFVTTALQHSRVKLTWDEDDPERLMVTRRKFTKDDLKEMDFKAYLASDIDDEDDEDISADDEAGDSSKTESMRAKYRALLNGGADSQSDKEAGDSQKDEEYEDMEITFAPGLSNLANKLLQAKREKSMQQNETVFETYLREKREKRKLNKKAKKAEENEPLVSEDERDIKAVANDDFFKDAFNGPEFNNGNAEAAEKTTAGGHKKSKDAPKRTKKRKGGDDDDELVDPDLELLFMDETERQRKHFDMDDIVKTGKKKAKKQKEEKENNDEFDINVSDDRFKALFESAEYAIDPTSAKFKKTKAMDKLLQERRERNADRSNRIKRDERVVNDPSKEQHSPSHLQSMVERIKQNASAVKKGKRTK